MNIFFQIFQLICLVAFFFSLSQLFTEKKWFRRFIIALGLVLAGFQLSSVLIGNSLIDYKYYQQFSFSIIFEMAGFYWKEAIILILGFFVPLLLLFKLSAFIQSRKLISKWKTVGLSLVFGGLMFLNNGIIPNLKEITDVHFASSKNRKATLEAIGLEKYVSKEEIEASAGKNIVFIALESVEYGYFQENLAHLVPNLERLANDYHLIKMEESKGSDNTISALYTYFTGIPMFFKKHGNNVFSNATEVHLNSVPHVLEKAGYKQLYLLGNADFAGMKNMFELMGIDDVKSEKNYDKKYSTYYWGLHDKDLFYLAEKELTRLLKKDQPFAFYCSTISTHHPNGVLDARIANSFPPQKSDLELMVSAVDDQVGQIVDFLKKKNALNNTVFYILPDHLLMGNSARVLNDFDYNRSLYLISNADTSIYRSKDSLFQIDIPSLLLAGAEVKHNASFLADFVEEDKSSFILDKRSEFVQLNEAFIDFLEPKENEAKSASEKPPKKPNKVFVESLAWSEEKKGESIIYIGDEEIKATRGMNLLTYENGKHQHKVFDTYENPAQVDSLYNTLSQLLKENAYFICMVHNSTGDEIKKQAEKFRNLGFIKMSKLGNRQAYVASSNYGIISEARENPKIKHHFPIEPFQSNNTVDEIYERCHDPKRFIAHAGGMIDYRTYTNCLEAMNLAYENGFKLFELDILKTSDDRYVCAHDWEGWKRKAGYEGTVPVDLATFLKYKIHGKYTPMDLDGLNKWFAQRPDAVLVTDKLNEPIPFIKQFEFQDRLMMELFSFDAIKDAQSVGLKDCILSEDLVQYLGKEPAIKLKEMGIEYLAVSQNTIRNRFEFYKKIHDAGIKTFAFHVNNPQLRDEAYICRELMDACYGLYADKWQIP